MEFLRTLALISALFMAFFGICKFVDWQYERTLLESRSKQVNPRTYCTYSGYSREHTPARKTPLSQGPQ